jgi:hypothetical protein
MKSAAQIRSAIRTNAMTIPNSAEILSAVEHRHAKTNPVLRKLSRNAVMSSAKQIKGVSKAHAMTIPNSAEISSAVKHRRARMDHV